ncbi:DUF4259 domain-containing protein [Sorangium sp. So ce119]|uniref:DUF4259 domain-containing protein n=1 Tax=Sorangium sp. So ce119 TaxID=3133279 RepID=UPI003F640511
MGTWGSGNFDSDGALDAYAGLVHGIAEQIDEGLGEGDVQFEDVDGEIALMEVLAVIGERCRALHLPLAQVESWARRVLAAYDAQIDALGATEAFKAERRAVLESTFDRLRAAVRAVRRT